ncbi:hypothetical protein GW17_00007546 [Ensete ventricosum]|uniref:Uncharacterized protein n=1 Tax=Ensete ventricosum TaxID=4639 RepID=A0A444FZD2_ENSVE|nr:hypothetical protein GW17_00007546 [Ensete ventricosum]RZR73302.1 hypothetical protein BHM03_00022534 [Ensete ventricosum]
MHREEMLEDSGNGAHTLSLEDAGGGGSLADDKVLVRSQGSRTAGDASEGQQIGTAPDRSSPEEGPKSKPRKGGNGPPSDLRMNIPALRKLDAMLINGRSSLGDALYRNITEEDFDAEAFLESADLSTEHKILDLKDRIEASVVIWKRKMNNKDVKSSWVSAVSWGKREQFEDRAETILLILKHRFPGIPQSQLDISKIQYNKVKFDSMIRLPPSYR